MFAKLLQIIRQRLPNSYRYTLNLDSAKQYLLRNIRGIDNTYGEVLIRSLDPVGHLDIVVKKYLGQDQLDLVSREEAARTGVPAKAEAHVLLCHADKLVLLAVLVTDGVGGVGRPELEEAVWIKFLPGERDKPI